MMRWIAYALPTLHVSYRIGINNSPAVLSVRHDDAHVPPELLSEQLAEGVDIRRVLGGWSVVILLC